MTISRKYSHLIEALQENYDYLKRSVAVYSDQAKSFNSKTHFFCPKRTNFSPKQLNSSIYNMHLLIISIVTCLSFFW